MEAGFEAHIYNYKKIMKLGVTSYLSSKVIKEEFQNELYFDNLLHGVTVSFFTTTITDFLLLPKPAN